MKKVLILLTVVVSLCLASSVQLEFNPMDYSNKSTTKSIDKEKEIIEKSELSQIDKYELELFKQDKLIADLKKENQQYKKLIKELKSLLKRF